MWGGLVRKCGMWHGSFLCSSRDVPVSCISYIYIWLSIKSDSFPLIGNYRIKVRSSSQVKNSLTGTDLSILSISQIFVFLFLPFSTSSLFLTLCYLHLTYWNSGSRTVIPHCSLLSLTPAFCVGVLSLVSSVCVSPFAKVLSNPKLTGMCLLFPKGVLSLVSFVCVSTQARVLSISKLTRRCLLLSKATA